MLLKVTLKDLVKVMDYHLNLVIDSNLVKDYHLNLDLHSDFDLLSQNYLVILKLKDLLNYLVKQIQKYLDLQMDLG